MLTLPRYDARTVIDWDRIVQALFRVDQRDDWLPDPVFHDDRSAAPARLILRLRSAWQAGTLPDPAVDRLALPRASGAPLTALVLPLETRLSAHAVISTFAPRVAASLARDKVYGFRLLRSGAAMFDTPGAELSDLFDSVAAAARATPGGVFELLDIVSFNASAQPARLATTLQQAGASPDESGFVTAIAGYGDRGLPSIDDAFAFAYNVYLRPVDARLVFERHNFLRYRDEYFVFDAAARGTLVSALAAVELQVRTATRSVNVEATIDRMNDTLPRKQRDRAVLATLPSGNVTASVSCTRIGVDDCTDYEETIAFEEASLEDRLRRAAAGPLDAVDLLPSLRRLNEGRRAGVTAAPPFAGEPPALAEYRATIARSRAALAALLAAGVRTGSTWQTGWSATLLADAGRLTDGEIAQLLGALESPRLGETAKVQARIALARSSTLPAERFWSSAKPATEFERRGQLLAARHLARRNAAPWNTLRQQEEALEPELVEYLTSRIRVRP